MGGPFKFLTVKWEGAPANEPVEPVEEGVSHHWADGLWCASVCLITGVKGGDL